MQRTRILAIAGLIFLLGTAATVVSAQDDPAEPETPPESTGQDAPLATDPQQAAPVGDEKKDGFWSKFSLFVEAGFGSTNVEDFNTSTAIGGGDFDVTSALSFGPFSQGTAAIGWQLPYDRGKVSLIYNGYREDGFSVSSSGGSRSVVANEATGELATDKPASTVPWWSLSIQDGTTNASLTPPVWDPNADDSNGNNLPDLDEIRYPETTFTSTSSAPVSLDNVFSTIDLVYGRSYGGRRYRGTWTAGFRYFSYKGNLISPAWLSRNPYIGYSSAALLNPIVTNQETEGIGPAGSMGFMMQFFRERLQVYFDAQFAFVLQTMSTSSGEFYILVPHTTNNVLYSGPAQLSAELNKDTWQLMGELGIRVRIVTGLTLTVAYYDAGFQDAYLSPTEISIPENFSQVFPFPEGLTENAIGLFSTHDLRFDGFRSALRFQF